MKSAVIFGAGGFIGHHLSNKLKELGYWVRGVDLVYPKYQESKADEFIIADLRLLENVKNALKDEIDEVYQLAADMGGAGYVFTGENDANIMLNSAQINLNTLNICAQLNINNVFFSSSACIYPMEIQDKTDAIKLKEEDAYPANPDSDYGWEKIFSERLFLAFNKNYNLNCKIARFHNIYGPLGVFDNGKEKAPAAICRKVANAKNNESIEIWGSGEQTRSFLYIEDCIDGILALMNSNVSEPVNIGSEELISINDLAKMVIKFSDKNLNLKHIKGPIGVKGRCSDNSKIYSKLNWKPKFNLSEGMKLTYEWINNEIHN